MTKERLKSPRVRLFVALDLPEEILIGLEAWGRTALSDPALRRPGAGSLHITLAFLGYRPEKDVERVARVARACRMQAPAVELCNPVARPPGRPRLFALPASSPGAELLQARLQEELVAERLYRPEKRRFWPHVTVARVRPEGRGSRRPMRVATPPKDLPRALRRPFDAVRVGVYRSELQPQGARYARLAQVELPGAGPQ